MLQEVGNLWTKVWILLLSMKFCQGLPNIKLSLEIMRSYSSKTGGDYVMSDAVEKAILPGINIIAQHLLALEEREARQELWLTLVSIVGGLALGSLAIYGFMRRMVTRKAMTMARVPQESVRVDKK